MVRGHRIAIAGFGNVGQALARLIARGHSFAGGVDIAAVSDPRFGTVISDAALDPEALIQAAGAGGFEGLVGYVPDGDVPGMIGEAGADTLVEVTFTDLSTGEPATTHVRRALEAGWNVSTTNKGPIALHLEELCDLARSKGVGLAFEGTVMSGTPVVLLARESVRHAGFRSAVGILNGTANHIICRIEEGVTYQQALTEAQRRGYAEADPSGDVEGHDAAAKIAILSQILVGEAIQLSEIERTPLDALTSEEVVGASTHEEHWRYVGTLEQVDGRWSGSVQPKLFPAAHPLAGVTGATNAITFHTELLGDITVSGPGAGRTETAFAVICDLRQIEKVRSR